MPIYMLSEDQQLSFLIQHGYYSISLVHCQTPTSLNLQLTNRVPEESSHRYVIKQKEVLQGNKEADHLVGLSLRSDDQER